MNTKKPKFNAGSHISPFLLMNLKSLYFSEIEKSLGNDNWRIKTNCYSSQGMTTFPLAIACWEALLNEIFMSDLPRHFFASNFLYEISEEAERWDIKTKTLMYPKFLFGKSLDKSKSYYSNFSSLISIRNNIIHFKHSLDEGPDKALNNLDNFGILWKFENTDSPWQDQISSTECIRWAVNTISLMVTELDKTMSDEYRKQCIAPSIILYEGITDKDGR